MHLTKNNWYDCCHPLYKLISVNFLSNYNNTWINHCLVKLRPDTHMHHFDVPRCTLKWRTCVSSEIYDILTLCYQNCFRLIRVYTIKRDVCRSICYRARRIATITKHVCTGPILKNIFDHNLFYVIYNAISKSNFAY